MLVKKILRNLGALFTELSSNINTLNEIKTNLDYKDYLNYDCLSLLLNTLYIDVGSNMLKDCYELRHNLTGIKYGHIDKNFLDLNIAIGNRLLGNIIEIRNKIALGQYVEPVKVSTVIWEPTSPPLQNPNKRQPEKFSAINGAYSKIVKIDDEKIGDLKKRPKTRLDHQDTEGEKVKES